MQKKCDQSEADLNNVGNILHSVGITDAESDDTNNILEKVHKNINMLHRKSEELTSRNLSLKLEIEKLKTLNNSSDVSAPISWAWIYSY